MRSLAFALCCKSDYLATLTFGWPAVSCSSKCRLRLLDVTEPFSVGHALVGFPVHCCSDAGRAAVGRYLQNINSFCKAGLSNRKLHSSFYIPAGFYLFAVYQHLSLFDSFGGQCTCFKKPSCPQPFINSLGLNAGLAGCVACLVRFAHLKFCNCAEGVGYRKPLNHSATGFATCMP